ncbi:MAG TPA: sugar kinase, partial [Acholeplasmataceae bacterium]|nr:sugar kinase [Acholeplasmataceae bacterium]
MKSILIIGGSNIDYFGKCKKAKKLSDSNVGTINVSFGGVGRNIAENLGRLGVDVTFI